MAALGIITLILTCFVMIDYAYLSRHTDRDVSFFMSVGIISIVMNLCTNAGGNFGIAWLYFVVALAFVGLSFLVSTQGTIDFYLSIAPWFKEQFSDLKACGFRTLSSVVFPAGIALYFVNYKNDREFARSCGRASLWGLLVWALLLWMILGLVL